jgi:hypothetical protein
MKRLTTASVLCLALALPPAGSEAFNGSIEYVQGVRVMNLWGTWQEMGYAEGYLLGPEIKELYEVYILELAGSPGMVESARGFISQYFEIPPEFQEMAAGMLAGMADTIDLYSTVYGRNLDVLDIYLSSSLPDLSGLVLSDWLSCSSLSAWGDATGADPLLGGDPAVSRNLDYFVDSQSLMLSSHLLVTFDPAEGQNWVSIRFPGFMGCLSGMNEHGVSASLNMGNYKGVTQWSPAFVPICMAQGLGLSDNDFDGSGQCDIADPIAALTEWNRSCSYCIHVTSPVALAQGGDPARVVEVNNESGWAIRYTSDDPLLAPDHLALTNHHRVLYPPVSCWRYSLLQDSIEADPEIDLDRLWALMGNVGFDPVPGSGGTVQTLLFMPETRRMGLAFSTASGPSYEKDPVWIDWADLFPNHEPGGIGDEPSPGPVALRAFPSPSNGLFSISAPGASPADLELRDLAGRLVQCSFSCLSPGVFEASTQAPAGMYVISLGTARVSVRVVVLR